MSMASIASPERFYSYFKLWFILYTEVDTVVSLCRWPSDINIPVLLCIPIPISLEMHVSPSMCSRVRLSPTYPHWDPWSPVLYHIYVMYPNVSMKILAVIREEILAEISKEINLPRIKFRRTIYKNIYHWCNQVWKYVVRDVFFIRNLLGFRI